MQQRSKNGWVVFTMVAVVALGSTLASTGLGRRANGKLGEARASLVVECTNGVAARSLASPCRLEGPRTPLMPEYRLGAKELDTARTLAATGRKADAITSLVTVLERADHIDRARSIGASLLAAKLFDGVSESVDADATLLDDPRLAVAIRRSSFQSSRRPLEAERLHALASLSTVPEQMPVRTLGLAEATTTQAMTDVDAALHDMENGAIAGDLKACEEAAERPAGLAKQVTVGSSICKSAARVVASGHRLQRLQARAAARSRQPGMKTARL